LVPQKIKTGLGCYTNEFGQIIQGGTAGLGWWDQFNSAHPENPAQKGKGKAKANSNEEIIHP